MTKNINRHGLSMQGLRKAAGETKGLTGYYSGHYVQVSYDTVTGDILTDYHYNLGQNSWSVYHDPDIITICNASIPMTMQQIADATAEAVARQRRPATPNRRLYK